MAYRVRSFGDEINIKTNDKLENVIMNAWNYEARVYDENDDLIFNGWLDNDEQNELLEPYDLEVFDYGTSRYLRNKKTGLIYLHDWGDNPFENKKEFKYKIILSKEYL